MGILPLMFTPPIILYLLKGVVMLPYPNKWDFLPYDTFPLYCVNYFIQIVGVYTAATVAVTMNSLLIMTLFHIRYQLDLIERTLKVIINEPEVSEAEFDRIIKHLVNLHAEVVR